MKWSMLDYLSYSLKGLLVISLLIFIGIHASYALSFTFDAPSSWKSLLVLMGFTFISFAIVIVEDMRS